jgi:glycosyltransferase involved in cell wall biosynthesis
MTKLAQAMAACDAVIVSTHALAAYAATIGKPVWVHQNAFSRQMLVLAQDALEHRRKSSDRVTIVYASGTPTHNSDFQVVRRALTHVLKSHPHVELLVIGDVDVGAGWASAGRRIRRLPPVHWTNLPRLLARADINIVPLETTNPFCRAKSEVKYIEASLVEIPTIASRIDSYATAIKHGDTGLLADDEGDWIEALETLVNDEACRHALGIRAKNDVISRYSPQVRAQHLRELLCAVQSLRRTNDGQVLRCSLNTDWVRPPVQPDDFTTLERRLHLVKRTLYSLRYKGLSVLLLEMWVFAARWLRVAAWRRKGTR